MGAGGDQIGKALIVEGDEARTVLIAQSGGQLRRRRARHGVTANIDLFDVVERERGEILTQVGLSVGGHQRRVEQRTGGALDNDIDRLTKGAAGERRVDPCFQARC